MRALLLAAALVVLPNCARIERASECLSLARRTNGALTEIRAARAPWSAETAEALGRRYDALAESLQAEPLKNARVVELRTPLVANFKATGQALLRLSAAMRRADGRGEALTRSSLAQLARDQEAHGQRFSAFCRSP